MKRILFLVLAAMISSFTASAGEPEWPQFRGPGAAGVAAKDATPPTQFGPAKNVKWASTVPAGASSPVIAGDSLFLTGFENNKLFTLAYDRSTGQEKWRVEAPAKDVEKYHKVEGSPAASSCATDGTIVVSYFGSAGLFAYDFAGKEVWKFELGTAKTGFNFGTGVSPVIVDGKVILARDLKEDSRLLAIDAKSGSLVWETKRTSFPTAWSTPAMWDTPAGKQIVCPGYGRMAAYDLATGKEVWTVKGMPSACCTTPFVSDGMLIYAGWSPGEDFKLPSFEELLANGVDADGDGKLSKKESEKTFIKDFFDNNDTNGDGFITKEEWEAAGKFMANCVNSAFAIKPGGTGDITESHVVWRTKNKKVLPYVPTGIVADGKLYLIKDGGLLSAYDSKTGNAVYESDRVGSGGQYYSSLIAANGHLYLTALNGDVHVVKQGDVPEVIFKGKLNERTAATPAVVGDTLYVRTATKLYAFAGR